LRTLLTEATYREDYERIRRDTRYEKLFEPEKWDVIIHVLAPPQPSTDQEDRFYSDSTSEVSSFVSSTDSGSPLKPNRNRRKKSSDTTFTESKSITDVRSMTEMMVDFGVDGYDDNSSVVSSVPGAARSIADRSSTEIVEFAPLEEDEDSHMGMGSNFSRTETRVTQQTAGTSSSAVFTQAQVSTSSTSGVFQQAQSSSSSTLYSTRRQMQ
jgi:hypothetical protein